MMSVMLLLAVSIAFAVVYNTARIAYAERERELATLRVLGFRPGRGGLDSGRRAVRCITLAGHSRSAGCWAQGSPGC
jgi:hypothetical protein